MLKATCASEKIMTQFKNMLNKLLNKRLTQEIYTIYIKELMGLSINLYF